MDPRFENRRGQRAGYLSGPSVFAAKRDGRRYHYAAHAADDKTRDDQTDSAASGDLCGHRPFVLANLSASPFRLRRVWRRHLFSRARHGIYEHAGDFVRQRAHRHALLYDHDIRRGVFVERNRVAFAWNHYRHRVQHVQRLPGHDGRSRPKGAGHRHENARTARANRRLYEIAKDAYAFMERSRQS